MDDPESPISGHPLAADVTGDAPGKSFDASRRSIRTQDASAEIDPGDLVRGLGGKRWPGTVGRRLVPRPLGADPGQSSSTAISTVKSRWLLAPVPTKLPVTGMVSRAWAAAAIVTWVSAIAVPWVGS